MTTPPDEDIEIRALSIIFSLLKPLDDAARRRSLSYLAERLSVSFAPAPTNVSSDGTATPRESALLGMLAVGIPVAFVGYAIVAYLRTRYGTHSGGANLPALVGTYPDFYALLFAVGLGLMLRKTHDFDAYRPASLREAFAKLPLSIILFWVFPVVLFVYSLPIVADFPKEVDVESLVLLGVFLLPLYGIHQTWLLVARPLGWSRAPEVQRGLNWFWWIATATCVLLPLVMVLCLRTIGVNATLSGP